MWVYALRFSMRLIDLGLRLLDGGLERAIALGLLERGSGRGRS